MYMNTYATAASDNELKITFWPQLVYPLHKIKYL